MLLAHHELIEAGIRLIGLSAGVLGFVAGTLYARWHAARVRKAARR